MLSEIQKAIIKGSSIRIRAGDGIVEILRGRIVNAEKGEKYGLEALVEIIDSDGDWTVEPLENIPPTTITEGWLSIKEKLFPSKGYNEHFSILFYKLRFDEDELLKFLEWISSTRFTGFVVANNYLLAFLEGEVYIARGLENGNLVEGEEGFLRFVQIPRTMNVYIATPKVMEIFIGAFSNLSRISKDMLRAVRIELAEEGDSGIILSSEGLEVFDGGIRIVNSSDREFVEMGFPDLKDGPAVGKVEEEEVKPLKPFILSRRDMEVLQRIYSVNVDILGEKVGRDMLRSILEEFKPSVSRPDSILKAMAVLIQRAKDIGGKGWLRKRKEILTEHIKDIRNKELRERLEELFKDF